MTSTLSSDTTTTPAEHTPREGAFGNATELRCRECGSTIPLGAHYACLECFGPLEVAYEYPAITREQIEAGPRNIWRYAPLLPVPADVASFPNTEPGLTRLVRAGNLATELGLSTLWVKDDSGNPTHSFKDRVVAVALTAARELGFQVLACPSTGNLANAVAAAAARAGIRSVVLVPQQPRAAEDPYHCRVRRHAGRGRGHVRRHQPARERDRRRGRGVGVRQRERPSVLRRGFEDARVRGRRTTRLAAARPDRRPGRLRRAAGEDRQGHPRADRARPGRGNR